MSEKQEESNPGFVRCVGWARNCDGKDIFRAIVEYPAGPPSGMIFAVVWDEVPVDIIVREEAKLGVAFRRATE